MPERIEQSIVRWAEETRKLLELTSPWTPPPCICQREDSFCGCHCLGPLWSSQEPPWFFLVAAALMLSVEGGFELGQQPQLDPTPARAASCLMPPFGFLSPSEVRLIHSGDLARADELPALLMYCFQATICCALSCVYISSLTKMGREKALLLESSRGKGHFCFL